jgi:hypothetical protein
MEKPQALFVAIQMGLELGLSPMAAVQNVAVVNGRPTLWGDAQLAVCRGTGELEIFEEWYESGGQKSARNPVEYKDDTAAVCRVKRAGGQVIEQAFSVADAKRANLWGKQGPWTQYPFRMLRNRARSFALRDGFGDALRGFRSTEEAMDTPDERVVTGREIPAAEVPRLFSGAAPATTDNSEEPHKHPESTRDASGGEGRTVSGAELNQGAAGDTPAPSRKTNSRSPAPAAPDADRPEPEPKEAFWFACEEVGMDAARVMDILKRNALTVGEFPADLTNEEVTCIRPLWSRIRETYAKEGGAE